MKCKIIILKGNKLSESIGSECIEQAAKYNLKFEKFDAVDGRYADEYLKIYKKAGKMRPGVIGCALSHIMLWKSCVLDNEPYFILEHDGYVIEHIPEDILDKFENILKLDFSNPYSENYEKQIYFKKDLDLEILDLPEDRKMIGLAGQYSRGTYGYIIKPHAAKLLLDWIDIHGFFKSDHQMGNNICKVSIGNKTIVRLHPFYLNKVKTLSLTNNL